MFFNISYRSSVFDIFGIVIYLQQIIWAGLSVLGAREKRARAPFCMFLLIFCLFGFG
jgi:hypothetical protein